MIRAGITGGIGSGKSLVCRYFESQQVPVYNADKEASLLIDRDPGIRKKLISRFGLKAYTSKGLNKPFIRKLVFSDEQALTFLNATTHPPVIAHFVSWCKERKKEKHPFVLKEAALIFESGSDKELDLIICVTAALETRIRRVMDRDKLSREHILDIVKRQMPEEEKIRRSDFVIHNEDDTLLLPQIVALHEALLNNKKNGF